MDFFPPHGAIKFIGSIFVSHATLIYDHPKLFCGLFIMFSGTTADFERLERSALSVFVGPRLNLAYLSMIVNFPGAEFP